MLTIAGGILLAIVFAFIIPWLALLVVAGGLIWYLSSHAPDVIAAGCMAAMVVWLAVQYDRSRPKRPASIATKPD